MLLRGGVDGKRAQKLISNMRDNIKDFHIGVIFRSRRVMKYNSR